MGNKVEARCPSCNVKVNAPVSLLGKKAKCPKCQNVFDVLMPDEPLAPIELEEANQETTPEETHPQAQKQQTPARKPTLKGHGFKKPFMKKPSFLSKPSAKPMASPYAKATLPKADLVMSPVQHEEPALKQARVIGMTIGIVSAILIAGIYLSGKSCSISNADYEEGYNKGYSYAKSYMALTGYSSFIPDPDWDGDDEKKYFSSFKGDIKEYKRGFRAGTRACKNEALESWKNKKVFGSY